MESFGKDTVYRVGGDEFLIVIGISEEDFKIRLINAKLSINNIKINNMRLNATISAGCCRGICHNDQDMRRMMNKADELLYIVKKSGKNGLKTQTSPLYQISTGMLPPSSSLSRVEIRSPGTFPSPVIR